MIFVTISDIVTSCYLLVVNKEVVVTIVSMPIVVGGVCARDGPDVDGADGK